MADKKISALTGATTPLDGTEVLPIVQGSATVKVANNDLRPKQIQSNATSGVLQVAGPETAATRVMTTPDANFTVARTDAAQSLTGDQTLSTGNLVIGTAGKGIDFSASPNPGGMTSELLSDYEEGTWTPSLGGDTTYTLRIGTYTKVGRVVTLQFLLIVNVLGTGSTVNIAGGPFTGVSDLGSGAFVTFFSNLASNVSAITMLYDVTTIKIRSTLAAAASTSSNAIFGNGARLDGVVVFTV